MEDHGEAGRRRRRVPVGALHDSPKRPGAFVLLSSSMVAVVWFHNRLHLPALAEGINRVHYEVAWELIAAMVPVIFSSTGYRLWHWRC